MGAARKHPGSGKRNNDFKEAVVLIPLTYNDGAQVPETVLGAIEDEIYRTFHGWTIEGTIKGAYRMRTGQKRVEELQKVSIILAASQVPALEAMVARWCARLGQEAMPLEISDSTVKFIPPSPETLEP